MAERAYCSGPARRSRWAGRTNHAVPVERSANAFAVRVCMLRRLDGGAYGCLLHGPAVEHVYVGGDRALRCGCRAPRYQIAPSVTATALGAALRRARQLHGR